MNSANISASVADNMNDKSFYYFAIVSTNPFIILNFPSFLPKQKN